MKALLIFITFLSIASSIFCQDTIQSSNPPDGFFCIDEFDTRKNIWHRKEFFDSILFTEVELDSSKFYSVGKYVGYYENGIIAFKRHYKFDGEHYEIHGKKQLFYPNSKLKEDGQYFHNIKVGNWSYYDENGNLQKNCQLYCSFY